MDDLVGDMSGARMANNGAIQADDSKAMVWFKREPKLMVAQSEMQGRQIWEDRDYVYVQQPGDKDAVRIEAFPMHARRWPRAWEAYQAGRKQIPDGTMIAILFPAEPGIAKNLQELGIHTIEQLAEMPDSSIGNIPFGGTLKQKAIKYMASVSGAQGFNKLSAEMAHKDQEISSLQMQISDLQARLAELAMRDPNATAAAGGQTVAAAGGFTPEQLGQIMALMQAAQPEKRGPGRPPKTPQEN